MCLQAQDRACLCRKGRVCAGSAQGAVLCAWLSGRVLVKVTLDSEHFFLGSGLSTARGTLQTETAFTGTLLPSLRLLHLHSLSVPELSVLMRLLRCLCSQVAVEEGRAKWSGFLSVKALVLW